MIVVAIVFWLSLAAIAYTHVGYPLLLRLLGRRDRPATRDAGQLPSVSLIVAAHDEADVIEAKVRDALALEYPPDRFELIIASDGSTDETVALARKAAAGDERVKVLDLERAGKIRTQDAAVEHARGDLLAFSDANAHWEPAALLALIAPFADRAVGYVCGELRYRAADGSNQEGLYWRWETSTRLHESRLHSITAGNGAIYAVRQAAYLRLDPRTSHDLSLPFNLVKRGWRALFEPGAQASEQPMATNEREFARKRRMMSHAWPTIARGGMLNPRGYGFVYGFEMFSHRALRYASPLLHVVALGCNVALVGSGTVYVMTLLGQGALLAAALLATITGGRPRLLAICQYYVLVTASIAAGAWDWLRKGTPTTWERAEGRA